MVLEIAPINLTGANELVKRHHRHHKPTQGGLFAIGLAEDGVIIGAAIIGRPLARLLQDGWTAEVTRVVVPPGHKNGCSMLYGAAWRAARAMGYRRLITYTLTTESGISLRAANWKCLGEAGGGTWNRASRPRLDDHPTQTKLRWEAPVERSP